jgi:hypothetical protein
MALHQALFDSLTRAFRMHAFTFNEAPSAPCADDPFQAELATLSPADREKRIAQRRRYEAFARHRGLVDAELDADSFRRTH